MMVERAGEEKKFSKERWRKMEKDGRKKKGKVRGRRSKSLKVEESESETEREKEKVRGRELERKEDGRKTE